MYSPKGQISSKFNSREVQIMQKAKTFGINSLSNPYLAKELFDIKFEQELEKSTIKKLSELYKIFDETIKSAQMSS